MDEMLRHGKACRGEGAFKTFQTVTAGGKFERAANIGNAPMTETEEMSRRVAQRRFVVDPEPRRVRSLNTADQLHPGAGAGFTNTSPGRP